MSSIIRKSCWLALGVFLAGVAWATLSDQFAYYDSSLNQGPGYALDQFHTASLPVNSIVSAIDSATGNYTNYKWTGTTFDATGDGGVVPGYGGVGGGSNGGGTSGGGGGTLGPGWGNVPTCRGECSGEVTVYPPQPV
jgi:hypothetical protein